MKLRSTLFLLFLAVVAFTSSCTKQYTCVCGIKYTGTPGLPDSTTQTYNITDTKSNATSKCSAASGTFVNTPLEQQNTITTVETCKLY